MSPGHSLALCPAAACTDHSGPDPCTPAYELPASGAEAEVEKEPRSSVRKKQVDWNLNLSPWFSSLVTSFTVVRGCRPSPETVTSWSRRLRSWLTLTRAEDRNLLHLQAALSDTDVNNPFALLHTVLNMVTWSYWINC